MGTTEPLPRYCKARDYADVVKKSIKMMHDQVGDLVLDPSGLAKRGLIVRHLVMPGMVQEGKEVVRWLAENVSKVIALLV